jgi:hypothetical protein
MSSFTAASAVEAFYTQGIDGKKVVCINPDHEHADIVTAMVMQANDDLGWDFSYEAVQDCLLHLRDTDGTPDQYEPEGANHIPCYHAERVAWLAEAPTKHLALCDEWVEEQGASANDLSDRIADGMYLAYLKAMEAVANNWPEEDDDVDAE